MWPPAIFEQSCLGSDVVANNFLSKRQACDGFPHLIAAVKYPRFNRWFFKFSGPLLKMSLLRADSSEAERLIIRNWDCVQYWWPLMNSLAVRPCRCFRWSLPPGKPIVASNGATTENISHFTDFFYSPALSNYAHIFRTPQTSSIKYGSYPECHLAVFANSWHLLAIYKHFVRGRNYSLRGVPKWSKETGTSDGWPLRTNLVGTDEELIHF